MFLDKLNFLMQQKGINKSELARESGVPYTTIDGFYKKGCDNIKLSTLMKLCDYFNVSLDYLLDNEKKPITHEGNELSNSELCMLNLFRTVPEERRGELLNLIEAALRMQGLLK